MTKKEEPRKYAKDRMEYFREFHSVVAPVVVLDGYDYERKYDDCLLYTSPSPRDGLLSRMPSSA